MHEQYQSRTKQKTNYDGLIRRYITLELKKLTSNFQLAIEHIIELIIEHEYISSSGSVSKISNTSQLDTTFQNRVNSILSIS